MLPSNSHSLARAASVLLILAGPAAATAADLVVFHDTLAGEWQNWSWGTTVNFANASPVYGGSGYSISVRHDAVWAGFYLHSGAVVDGAMYNRIRFQLHGGAGGQLIRFVARDAGGTEGTALELPPLAAGWTAVEVTLAELGLTNVVDLFWQDRAGSAQPTYYLDEIVFLAGPPPPAPALAVDVTQARHPISELIYGLNWADPALLPELRIPVHRWGGNSVTRYNWQNDTSNRASDWYFENIPNANPHPELLPDGSSADQFVADNLAAGTETLLTIPLIGWTPKARAFECGFRVSRYGAQQSTDPWQPDCGNGVRTNGQEITGNNPADTSVAIGPGFVQDWMLHLADNFGPAGVRFYNLDNEPMLWNSTHRDVHPTACGYDKLRDRTVAYAATVKAVDPLAQTLGPVFWGWTAYFYSALDIELGGGEWWNTRPDRMAHGDVPLVEWYLEQLHAYELSHGVRLLDYLDLHFYPQANSVALQPAGNAAVQALRLRSTRALWDPTYVDESWIGEAVQLIPRMRAWAATRYPGTKTAITEYNWGGFGHINGALAQADVLGIFGRERLDLATLWTAPEPDDPVAFAFRMYRNHDGAGHGFGETSVQAGSTDQGQVAIYAAERADGALTLLLINKSPTAQVCPLSVAGFGTSATAAVYRYSDANLSQIVRLADVPFSAVPGAPLTPPDQTIDLPANSLTLLVLAGGLLRGDLNCDGAIGFADINPFVLRLADPAAWQAAYPGCDPLSGDINGDGQVGFADINPFVALLANP